MNLPLAKIPLIRSAAYPLIILIGTIIACSYYWLTLIDKQHFEMEAATHRGELHVQQINEAVDQQIDATIRSVDTALRHLRTVYLHDRKNFDRFARDILAAYPKEMIKFIIVVGADGYLTYSSNVKPNAKPDHIFFGDREDFRVQADSDQDQLFISKPIIGRIAGNRVIQFTRPIREGKRFVGVIGIPLRPDYLSNNLWSLHIDPNDLISIVREDGRIIARSRNLEEGLNLTTPSDRPFMHSHPGEHGIFRSVSITDNVPLLFSWRHLDNYPIIAVTAIDEVVELGGITSQQSAERIRSVISIALVVSFAVWISALIVRNEQKNIGLSKSEERWKFALEGAGDGVWDWNPISNEVVFSGRWKEIIGYTEQEFPNTIAAWEEHLRPNEKERVWASLQEYFESKKKFYINEFQLRCKDGSWKWILARGMIVKRDLDGSPLRMIGTHTDITERKLTEARLRTLSTAIEQSPVSVIITDLEANIKYVNPRFTEVTGFTAEEALGQNPRILKSALTPKEIHQELWQTVVNGKIWHGELINKRKNGEIYWEDAHIAPVRDDAGIITHYVATKVDISERKLMEEKVRHLAQFDVLTDLPNRSLFSDRLQQALAVAKRDKTHMALMFIDLDKFKPVNDEFGHQMGDLLLQEAAKRMLECIRASDTVARLGGDEFVVLLPTIEAEQDALLVAEKIRHALNKPFALLGKQLHISSSTGIVVYPQHGIHEEELFKNADVAMYSAKAGGRNAALLFNANMRKSS